LVLAAALFALTLSAAADDASKPAHFLSRSLRNISAQQATDYLARAQLGTASQIPNTNTILVTAGPTELAKASTLLELLDSKEPYTVVLLPAEPNIVSKIQSAQFAKELRELSVGSFAAPPTGDKPRAIVDTLDQSVIVAAPADRTEQVLSVLKKLPEPSGPAQPAETNQPGEVNQPTAAAAVPDANKLQEDRFFNQILDSLAEAEKVQAQLRAEREKVTAQTPPAEEQTRLGEAPQAPPEPSAESGAQAQPDLSRTVELTPKEVAPPIKRLTYEPNQTKLANEELELELPETINVTELIDLVGKYLNLDLLYDPKEITGSVTLRVQHKIKVGELYPLLESVLKFRGFAMSRRDNFVTIVPIANALDTDTVLLDSGHRKLKFGDVIVTRIFDLRYIDTTSATNLLNDMKLGAHITAVPDAKKLIVTDYAYRMNRVEDLLGIIDKPGELKQFRYRQLRYTMAANLVSQVEALAEQLGTLSIAVAAKEEQPAAPTPVRGRRVPVRRAPQPTPAPQPTKSEVYLDADDRTNRILMIGLPEQLDIIETLIDSLDVAQQDLRTLRLYDIHYAGADDVVEKLQALGIISGTAAKTAAHPTRGRITAPQPGQPAEAAAPAATVLTEEGLVEEPQVVVIESTNSLLVNATAEQHAQIALIIGYVDAEPEQAAINYVVYPLENQDPTDLAGVLNQLVQQTVQETSQGADSKIVKTTTKKLEEDITIIPDPKTYSLVVYASKKNQQWISSLIKELDEYRPQVLLDVTLVEITKNDAFNYDLDLVSSIPNLGVSSGVSTALSQIGSAAAADVFNKIHSTPGNPADRSRFAEGSVSSGHAIGFYGTKQIMGLLDLVQTKGYGRILAKPKLLVNDNEQGTITTKQLEYVAQAQTNIVPTGTGTTTTQSSVSYTSYPTGIELTIQPHISKGNQLRLKINLNRSDFIGSAETVKVGDNTFTLPRNTTTSDITTVVTVPDGTTIILGGLEKLTQSKGGNKVPLIGDVPLVGGLFRNIANTNNQDRLYIFVKAHILRPGQEGGISDIAKISGINRATFEKYESEMQNYQDWPGIKPKPMDPLQVLEGQ
jgi:general secretion pathway protein D